jgi:hypothetical protein
MENFTLGLGVVVLGAGNAVRNSVVNILTYRLEIRHLWPKKHTIHVAQMSLDLNRKIIVVGGIIVIVINGGN